MDILTRMRSMTPESLAGVRTDFDDAPKPVYVSKASKDMIRTVEGADDLRHPNAGRTSRNAGMSKAADWSDKPEILNVTVEDEAPQDARSPRQIETMTGLHMQLAELDAEIAADAMTYTTKMTAAGRWTPGYEGNASKWIGRMIKKVRELKAVAPATPVAAPIDNAHAEIPKGYYAVADSGPDDIKFYRVSQYQGRTYVKVQASDELHPIQNAATRKAILDAIVSMGWQASTALYGAKIGRCGRCRRTLTDADSRARGIGPDCWGKM